MSTIPQLEKSVFDGMKASSYPFRYEGSLHINTLLGGVPSDPNVIEGWLRTKLGLDKETALQEQVAKIMIERGISADEAALEVARNRSLNGFKRARCAKCDSDPRSSLCTDGQHQLFIEGRQLKAALKEAGSIAVAANKLTQRGWGATNKGLLGFFAEHVFVVEDELYLTRGGAPVYEPTQVLQHFVHSRFGSAIQYQESVEGADVDFTVITDYLFTPAQWSMIWTTGEMNGLGASRSQGYGRYAVIKWDDKTPASVLKKAAEKEEKITAKVK